MKKLALSLALTSMLSGCASFIDGKHQTMTLMTKNNTEESVTNCQLTNSKGLWISSAQDSLVVQRDYDDLLITCENDKQKGETTVTSSASYGFMALNAIIFDLCTISCIVDHHTGALYEYPTTVVIPMEYKTPETTTSSQEAISSSNES